MNKREKQKRANIEFSKRIDLAFYDWRKKRGKDSNVHTLLEYLVRHNIINQTIINRWLCIDEYKAQLELTKKIRPHGNKQVAIWNTEELVPLGETQIKSNIIHHTNFFRDQVHKFP